MEGLRDDQFDVLTVSAQWVAYVRITCDKDKIGTAIMAPGVYDAVYALAKKRGVKAGPPYARYIEWRENDCDILCGVPITGPMQPEGKVMVDQYTSCRMVAYTFVGPYHELGKAHDAVIAFIKAKGLKHGGPCWEIYDGPGDEKGIAKTHVCYALEPD